MGKCNKPTFWGKFDAFLFLIVQSRSIDDILFLMCSQRLTPDQKESYKQKAKMQPAKVVQVAPKFTSHGVSLEKIDQEQRELSEKQKYMERKTAGVVEDSFLENGRLCIHCVFLLLLSWVDVVNQFSINAFYHFESTDIHTRPFVFIMANYFYKTSDGIFSPAEIAVAKFCFENGILKKYHTFVDPGNADFESIFMHFDVWFDWILFVFCKKKN